MLIWSEVTYPPLGHNNRGELFSYLASVGLGWETLSGGAAQQ
jgi:hypothetical protein